MINYTAIKADFKLIVREPILVLFMIFPIFFFSFFKLLIIYAVPFIHVATGFDLTPYYGYVLATALLLPATMLGTVIGFLMIDDRDARIFDLMSVTPLGYLGYIFMRVLIPFSLAFVYAVLGYYFLDIFYLNPAIVLYIGVLTGISGVLVGIFLFAFAEDKVQGLTYSKGMGIFNLLAVADLFGLAWLSMLAAFTPFYWIVRLVTTPTSITAVILALVVHLCWLAVLSRAVKNA